jgi:hypothetical protein
VPDGWHSTVLIIKSLNLLDGDTSGLTGNEVSSTGITRKGIPGAAYSTLCFPGLSKIHILFPNLEENLSNPLVL